MKSIIYGDDKGMFGDFFRYWDELPQDGGFRLFGWIHICWLVGIIFVCIVTGYYYRCCCSGQDPENTDGDMSVSGIR